MPKIWQRQRIFIWSLLVILLDWITKKIAVATLVYHEPQVVIPLLNWTLVYNKGAAFSFLANHAGWQRWFLSAVAVVAIALFYRWCDALPDKEKWQRWAIAWVIGGALGNLIDRLRLGYVIDFIDVHWHQHHWPAFNIADSAIFIGLVVLLASICTSKKPTSS